VAPSAVWVTEPGGHISGPRRLGNVDKSSPRCLSRPVPGSAFHARIVATTRVYLFLNKSSEIGRLEIPAAVLPVVWSSLPLPVVELAPVFSAFEYTLLTS
jgi:hypothetical protein